MNESNCISNRMEGILNIYYNNVTEILHKFLCGYRMSQNLHQPLQSFYTQYIYFDCTGVYCFTVCMLQIGELPCFRRFLRECLDIYNL